MAGTDERAASESTVAGERAIPEVDRTSDAPPSGTARYVLGRRLGAGGMGEVFEADDLQFGRRVAIKRLRRDAHAGARDRFEAEARITGGLDHPGVPSVHDRGVTPDGIAYYAMQKIEGRTLGELLRDCRDDRERLELLPLLAQAAQTVGYAHSRGVVHRDLKPDNIVVARYGQVVVIDWGLAKLERGPARASTGSGDTPRVAADLTIEGAVLGTPAYMAPEQAAGRTDAIDARTDVFGLGAILYQLLTGRPPFASDSAAEAITRAAEAAYPPIRERAPRAPAAVVAICERALARDPDKRMRSAEQLAEQLTAYTRSAVSSAGARALDWVSAAVGTIAVLGVVAAVPFVASSAEALASLGPMGTAMLAFTVLGSALSIVEWTTRGKYRLASVALGLAGATLALGFTSFGTGLAEGFTMLSDTVTEREPIELQRLTMVVIAMSSSALGIGAAFAGLQVLLWGVARRRAAFTTE